MKEIRAYIKPHKLGAVTLALHGIEGLTGMSLTEVRGFGRSKSKNAPHRLTDDLMDYVPHVKIEIICRDELVETVVGVIQKAAHTAFVATARFTFCPWTRRCAFKPASAVRAQYESGGAT